MSKSKGKLLQIFIVFLSVGFVVSTLAGCASMRQKFVRKKTAEKKDEFIPVLEPIDYAPIQYSPEERYSYHYNLWKVWEKDFALALDESRSNKRQSYLLTQLLAQIEEMTSWIKSPQKDELKVQVEGFQQMLGEFDKPESMRDYSMLKRELRQRSKEVRLNFSPDMVQEFLVEAQ